MNVSEATLKGRKILDLKGVVNGKLDSLILLCHALSFTKEQVVFNPELELNKEQEDRFLALIGRRSEFEPISHIIGKREFYGEDFIVNQDVLDPRPDTESLIELVLQKIPRDKEMKILELGIGSGCISITLLRHYECAYAVGVDISKAALQTCQNNIDKHQVSERIILIESNLFSAIDQDERFDLIVSNPPYITSKDIHYLAPEVRMYEPKLALDGGVDGLDFYRDIASQSRRFLKDDGKIILEIGCGQHDDVIDIFVGEGFYLIESKCDLSSIIRVLYFGLDEPRI